MEPAFNPYAPPQVPVAVETGRMLFPELSTKEVSALYYRAHNIITLTVLWGFWVLYYAVVPVEDGQLRHPLLGPDAVRFLRAVQVIVFSLAIICCVRWDSWGRRLGLAACGGYIIGLNPLSMIVGVFGMGSLLRARPLFGPKRMHYRDLKSEFKHRRRNRVG
jgi:hypothetical protein